MSSINNTPLGDYTYENFLKAISLLFKNNDKKIKKLADQFICEFEKSPNAWDTAIKILNTDNLDEEAYYNAFQIMKKKIRYDFGNYIENQDLLSNLATFFIDKIICFKNSQTYFISNICKCFTLSMIFAHKNFTEIIKMTVGRLNGSGQENMLSLVMIFNFLADQVNDDDIVIDEQYRVIYEKNLEEISADVMIFIDYVIKIIGNSQEKEEIIKSDPKLANYFRLFHRNVIN
jgi:hypothetical protein